MAKFMLEQVLRNKVVSQYKLSQLLKISTGEVSRWCKSDHNPTLKTLNKIADVLGVRVSDLLDEEGRGKR